MIAIRGGQEGHRGAAEGGREPRGRELFPLHRSGLPHLEGIFDARDPDRPSPLLLSGRRRWPLFCDHNRPNRNPGLHFHALRCEAYCGFGEIILISDRGEKVNWRQQTDWSVLPTRFRRIGLRPAREAQLHQAEHAVPAIAWQAAEKESARRVGAGAGFSTGFGVSGM